MHVNKIATHFTKCFILVSIKTFASKNVALLKFPAGAHEYIDICQTHKNILCLPNTSV